MNKNLNNIINHSHFRKAGFILSIFWVAIAIITLFYSNVIAQLNTKCCTDCHVFHAWQDEKIIKGSKKLYASILEDTCEGCHASADSKTLIKSGDNIVPIVKTSKEPEAPLAGGNFYYESGQRHLEKAGHCTSCHKDVRHHGTSPGYRFIGENVGGIGDPQYEHGEGHNIYKSGDEYCSACHANFCGPENQRSSTGWIRHPTNIQLPFNGEYAGYQAYRKDVPVSFPNPNNPSRASARVMCMSCHRPHGTPYNFLLRWDYNIILAGNENNSTGCFACHTTKDTGVQGVEVGFQE